MGLRRHSVIGAARVILWSIALRASFYGHWRCVRHLRSLALLASFGDHWYIRVIARSLRRSNLHELLVTSLASFAQSLRALQLMDFIFILNICKFELKRPLRENTNSSKDWKSQIVISRLYSAGNN